MNEAPVRVRSTPWNLEVIEQLPDESFSRMVGPDRRNSLVRGKLSFCGYVVGLANLDRDVLVITLFLSVLQPWDIGRWAPHLRSRPIHTVE